MPGGDFSIARLAQTLNTTTAHAIYLLSPHPVDWSRPRCRRTQYTATRIGQWRTWYEDDHYSLQDIADMEGTSLATVRLATSPSSAPDARPQTAAPLFRNAPPAGHGPWPGPTGAAPAPPYGRPRELRS